MKTNLLQQRTTGYEYDINLLSWQFPDFSVPKYLFHNTNETKLSSKRNRKSKRPTILVADMLSCDCSHCTHPASRRESWADLSGRVDLICKKNGSVRSPLPKSATAFFGKLLNWFFQRTLSWCFQDNAFLLSVNLKKKNTCFPENSNANFEHEARRRIFFLSLNRDGSKIDLCVKNMSQKFFPSFKMQIPNSRKDLAM